MLNRYKVLEKLGGGGMSVVWKAYDLVLDRNVALKVLRAEMSEDDEFILRFRREAKSVASLSHPNIVNIYDVGEDSGLYFIIMELVEGETLRDKLRAMGRLPVSEALSISSKICQGLSHAHARRIIHRDIKPQNILLTAQGDVKVADFGIARALGGVSTTSRDVVVGSAPYISPEQAKNGTVSTRSDLYSLGVVLYEMLTGKPPFAGDSPVAVAYQHVQAQVPKLAEACPDIPTEVDRLVQKALSKEPEKRFSSAEDMQGAIEAALAKMGRAGVLQTRTENTVPGVSRGGDEGLGRQRSKKKSLSLGLKVFLVLAALVVALGVYALSAFRSWMTVPEVDVPDVVGKTFVDAQSALKAAGLVFQVSGERPHDSFARGEVIEQSPLGGERVKKGREVYCLVSKGPNLARVPDVRGLNQIQAVVDLQNAGVQLGDVKETTSQTVAKGLVVSQNPYPGLDVPRDSLVDLEISKGPEPETVVVPSVVGMTQEEAVRVLEARLLEIANVVLTESSGVAPGRVVRQLPEADEEVALRTKVTLVVASSPGVGEYLGKKVITVPHSPSGKAVNVQVFVKDQQGERQIFDGNLAPGETRELEFAWQGASAVVRTVIGGKVSIETIRPPGR